MIEARKTTTLGSSTLLIPYGQSVKYDNSSDIDEFWDALKECVQATYPSDKVTISDTTIQIELSDYATFSFHKENGVKFGFSMPFMFPTPDERVLRGLEIPLIMPEVVIDDTFDLVSFRMEEVKEHTAYGDLGNFLVFLRYMISRSKLSYDTESKVLLYKTDGIVVDKEEIVNFASEKGVSLSIPEDAAYFKLYAEFKIPVLRENLDSLQSLWRNATKVSFYDSGVIVEPYEEFKIPISSLLINRGLSSFSLKVETYDSNDNLLGTGKVLATSNYSDNPSELRFGLLLKKRFVRTFSLVKPENDIEVLAVVDKASSTEPEYELEDSPVLVSPGDYVVVFSENEYAYRIVTEVSGKNVTFDQELPFDIGDDKNVWMSNYPPAVVAFDVGVVEEEEEYFTFVDVTLSAVKYTNFLDEADADYSKLAGIGLGVRIGAANGTFPSAYVLSSADSGQSVGDYLMPLLYTVIKPFSNKLNVPLPKYPVADGQLNEEFLRQFSFLSPSLLGLPGMEKVFALKATLVQKVEEGIDIFGSVPMFVVYDPTVLSLFPNKAFLNKSQFRVADNNVFILSFIEENTDEEYALFKVESEFMGDRNYVARV